MTNTHTSELGNFLDVVTIDLLGFTCVVNTRESALSLELLLNLPDGWLVGIEFGVDIFLLDHINADDKVGFDRIGHTEVFLELFGVEDFQTKDDKPNGEVRILLLQFLFHFLINFNNIFLVQHFGGIPSLDGEQWSTQLNT